jgi:hypothetical protein
VAKSIVVFDHETGQLDVIPLAPGGYVTFCEPPMHFQGKTETADGLVTIVLKRQIVPDSPEGAEFLNGQ